MWVTELGICRWSRPVAAVITVLIAYFRSISSSVAALKSPIRRAPLFSEASIITLQHSYSFSQVKLLNIIIITTHIISNFLQESTTLLNLLIHTKKSYTYQQHPSFFFFSFYYNNFLFYDNLCFSLFPFRLSNIILPIRI